MSEKLDLECASHGTVRWQSHIICAQSEGGCGRIYHCVEGSGNEPPEVVDGFVTCKCGASLWSESEAGLTPGTARSICSTCYHDQQLKN